MGLFFYMKSNNIRWRDEFNGERFFSHGKTISCGVATGFYGSKTIDQTNKLSGKSERIILVEATIGDTVFVLINICNVNPELEQIEILSNYVVFLKQKYNFWRCVTFHISLESFWGNPCLK